MPDTQPWATICVIGLLALAGCVGGGPISTEPTDDTSGEQSQRGPSEGTEWTVTVTRVIDGDTVEVRFPDGEEDTIRLLGVDTPETTYGDVSPDEYEGFPESTAARDHLFNWGERASQHATETLAGNEVRFEIDDEADRRGYFGRLLGYIYVDGENFNKQLLTDGYARYYDSSFSKDEAFETAEETARSERRGLWGFDGVTSVESDDSGDSTDDTDSDDTTVSGDRVTSPRLDVSDINEDAPGNDNTNLNGEYVTFENTGEAVITIGGWTVQDEARHTYTFPADTELSPGEQVTLYTGSGTNNGTALYWAASGAVWNNGGDTITVTQPNGTVVLRRPY